MDNLILLILGLFISVLGITNIKGNISTIHSYNRRKVKEEDIPKYGKVVGTGTLIMGVSFILGYIALFWSETAMAVIILPRVVVGLVYIAKYTIGKIALGLDYFERRISCLESNGYTFRIDGGSMGIPQMVL